MYIHSRGRADATTSRTPTFLVGVRSFCLLISRRFELWKMPRKRSDANVDWDIARCDRTLPEAWGLGFGV